MEYITYSYSVFHNPTKKWVKFEQDEEYNHLFSIVLVDSFENGDKFQSKTNADLRLRESYMFKEMYGKKNLLEFDILKFKTIYTNE